MLKFFKILKVLPSAARSGVNWSLALHYGQRQKWKSALRALENIRKTRSSALDVEMLKCSMYHQDRQYIVCIKNSIEALSLLDETMMENMNEYLYRRAVLESLIGHSRKEEDNSVYNDVEIGTVDLEAIELSQVPRRVRDIFPLSIA